MKCFLLLLNQTVYCDCHHSLENVQEENTNYTENGTGLSTVTQVLFSQELKRNLVCQVLAACSLLSDLDSRNYNPGDFDLIDLGSSLSDMSSSLAGFGIDGDTSLNSFGAPGMGNMSLSEYLSATQEMATLYQSIGDGTGSASAEDMSRMVELVKSMGIEVPDMSNWMPNMAMSGMPDSGSMPAGFDMSGFSQGNPYDFANEGGK